MKRIRLSLIALLAVVMTTLTSCLGDTSSDNTQYSSALVTITNSYGSYEFTTISGVKLVPTASSIAAIKSNNSSFDMSDYLAAYITYSFVDESPAANATSYAINLTGIARADQTYVPTSKDAANDSLAVTTKEAFIEIPQWTLYDEKGTSYKQDFVISKNYSNEFLWIMHNFYFGNKTHYLSLVNYPEENTEDAITFHLVNNGHGDKTTSYTTSYYASSYPGLYYSAFPIRNTLADYCEEYGKTSCKIIIKAMINSGGYAYESGTEKEYTLTYENK